jgi:hypothetical protein
MRATIFVAILTIWCGLNHGYAQKVKYYKARVTLNNDSRVKGVLYAADEEGLILIDNKLLGTIMTVGYGDIELIKVRKRGRVGNSALIGGAGGTALGALIGFAGGDDPEDCWILCYTAEEKALMGAVALVIPGAGIGALIGTESKKFEINGDLKQYKRSLSELKKYALK